MSCKVHPVARDAVRGGVRWRRRQRHGELIGTTATNGSTCGAPPASNARKARTGHPSCAQGRSGSASQIQPSRQWQRIDVRRGRRRLGVCRIDGWWVYRPTRRVSAVHNNVVRCVPRLLDEAHGILMRYTAHGAAVQIPNPNMPFHRGFLILSDGRTVADRTACHANGLIASSSGDDHRRGSLTSYRATRERLQPFPSAASWARFSLIRSPAPRARVHLQ
jgi:hypothetical protein